MTKQELNRDWKRLAKRALDKPRGEDTSDWTEEDWLRNAAEEREIRNEIERLYNADRSFEYANKNSVLIFLALNQRFRAVTLHAMATGIDIKTVLYGAKAQYH